MNGRPVAKGKSLSRGTGTPKPDPTCMSLSFALDPIRCHDAHPDPPTEILATGLNGRSRTSQLGPLMSGSSSTHTLKELVSLLHTRLDTDTESQNLETILLSRGNRDAVSYSCYTEICSPAQESQPPRQSLTSSLQPPKNHVNRRLYT